jgi:hypothetical protein
MKRNGRFSMSRIMTAGLFLVMGLSVFTCWFYNTVTYFMMCFCWCCYLPIPVFVVWFYPCFFAYIMVYVAEHTHCHCASYIVLCQHWARWYYVVYCIVTLLKKSAICCLVSDLRISVEWHLVFNAPGFGAIISLSVSACRSPPTCLFH